MRNLPTVSFGSFAVDILFCPYFLARMNKPGFFTTTFLFSDIGKYATHPFFSHKSQSFEERSSSIFGGNLTPS